MEEKGEGKERKGKEREKSTPRNLPGGDELDELPARDVVAS